LDADIATQRPTSEVYTVIVKPRQIAVHTPEVQKSTTARVAYTVIHPTLPEEPTFTKSNSAEDIALALLEQLDSQIPGDEIVSDGNNIILSFGLVNEVPGITAHYDKSSGTITLRGINRVDHGMILQFIGPDLKNIFVTEMGRYAELETRRLLGKFEPVQDLLESSF
jgi:hypothetical protein